MADPTQVAQITQPLIALGGGTAPTTPSTSDQIMSQLQSQSGVVSSSDADIQTQYQGAIDQLKTAGAADQVAIENKYNPLIANQQIKGQQNLEGGLETNHGYGLNAALLQTINKQSDDDMQSLIEERDSAMATGQADTAKSISDLMVKALQDKASNTQKVFDNLLNIASFGETAKKNAADIANQQFTQQSTMTTLAAQYGITVDPGETMQTLANKIAPVATKEENAKMNLEVAQTYEAHANGLKAVADANAANTKTEPAKLQSIADSINIYGGIHSQGGQALLASLKNASDQADVISLASQAQAKKTVVSSYVDNGVPIDTARADLLKQFNAGTISSSELTFLNAALPEAYKNAPATPAQQPSGYVSPGTKASRQPNNTLQSVLTQLYARTKE